MEIKKHVSLFLHPFIIILTGVVVYFNVLANGFVWLDSLYVTAAEVGHINNILQLFHGSALTGAGFYRPFNALYFTLTHTLLGNSAYFYHLIQIIFWIMTTLIINYLFKSIMNKNLALFLSLIFMVHPVNESVVAFISNSADVFYMFFGVLSVYLWINMTQGWRKISFISILLLCALLFKESAIIFLIFILLLQYFFRQRYLKIYSLALGVTMLTYVGFRSLFHGFQFYQIDLYPIMRLTFMERLMNIPSIFFYYIRIILYPKNLGVNLRWTITDISFSTFYFPLLIDICIALVIMGMGWWIYRKKKRNFYYFLVLYITYVISILGVSQIIPLDYTVAARWLEFPMFALLGISGLFIESLAIPKPAIKPLLGLAVGLLLLLSVRTIERNTNWNNNITLFSRALHVDDNFISRAWLANAYMENNQYQQALLNIKTSVNQFPYDNNLALEGLIYEKMGLKTKAASLYVLAEKTDNYAPNTHDDATYQILIRYYLKTGNNLKAQTLLLSAVNEYPTDDYLWTLLALVDYSLKQKQQALTVIQKAASLNPSEPIITEVYQNIITNAPFDFHLK